MSGLPLLLDTHAAVWLALGEPLQPGGRQLLEQAWDENLSLHLSAVSAWEVAMLVAKGRVRLGRDPLAWFDELERRFGIQVAELTPAILVASVLLPGALHPDPADRMIAATARAHGWRLLTRDARLLAYAEQGWIEAAAC